MAVSKNKRPACWIIRIGIDYRVCFGALIFGNSRIPPDKFKVANTAAKSRRRRTLLSGPQKYVK